jgi:hypothetical protein
MSYGPDDFANPYAAPLSEIGRSPADAGFGTTVSVPFTIGDILSYSQQVYRERMGLCMGAVWAVIVLNWLYQLATNLLSQGIQNAGSAGLAVTAVFLLFAVGIVFQSWLTLGQSLTLLKVVQRRDTGFTDVFAGGPFLLRLLVLVLLSLVALFLAGLLLIPALALFAFPRNNQGLVYGQVALGVLVGIGILYVVIRFSQFLFVMIDRNAGLIESLTLSARLTKGHALRIFLIWIVAGLINLCGFMACLVGLIYTMPLTMVMGAVTYVSLCGKQGVGSRFDAGDFQFKPETPADNDFDGVL